MIYRIVPIALTALLLAGCATGAPGSARRMCYDAGLQPGTAEFSDCWKARASADTNEVLGGALVVGAVAAAANAPPPSASFSSDVSGRLKGQSITGGNRMCVYATNRGDYILTVRSTSSCPLSLS